MSSGNVLRSCVVNENAEQALDVITTVLLSINIVACALLVFTILRFQSIRSFPLKLIMYLTTCIGLASFFFLIADRPVVFRNIPGCKFVAVMVHFFYLAVFCWTGCIATNFYFMIVQRTRDVKSMEKFYHIFSWGVPSLIAIICGATGIYGPIFYPVPQQAPPATVDQNMTGPYYDNFCYVNDPIGRFAGFFMPAIIIITYNSFLFFVVGYEIHTTFASAPRADSNKNKKELRIFISITASVGLGWIFGYLVFLPNCVVSMIFRFLFALVAPTQGIFLFVIYGLTKKVGAKYMGWFGKVFGVQSCLDLEQTWGRTTASASQSRSGPSSRSGNSTRNTSSQRAAARRDRPRRQVSRKGASNTESGDSYGGDSVSKSDVMSGSAMESGMSMNSMTD